MKRKYIWDGKTFVDVTGWRRPAPRFPAIHRDGMDALVHPATGETYDSKSRFREVTRAHGMVELGNDIPTSPKSPLGTKKERKQDIADAITMLEQGYEPPPVESVSDWGEIRMYGGT